MQSCTAFFSWSAPSSLEQQERQELLKHRIGRMKISTRVSEMQKFHFGGKVVCTDGEAGSLSHVVFDPTNVHLTHLGVKQGRLFGKVVTLPYDTVASATSAG